MDSGTNVRPTKKQRELLQYIEKFISEHGYSPSYREIMEGLKYNSVATVALHVGNLIKRGHLIKRDRSARSLELTKPVEQTPKLMSNTVSPGEEKWLVEKVEYFFKQAESLPAVAQQDMDKLFVLLGALRVLDMEGAAQSFMPRLTELKKKLATR